jgi:hypothetical protein
LLIRQRRSLLPTLCQQAKYVLASLPLFYLGDGATHQVGNDSTLVLSTEYPVELSFDVIWNAEIYRSHREVHAVVENFNNRMVPEWAAVNLARRRADLCHWRGAIGASLLICK